jgi:CRISPR-associated endonuclease/helicase Cas3
MEIKIWGKSKVNEKEVSLTQHINDVLEVFQYLGKKVKKQPDLKELIKIVIEYHDAGKALPYFQRKTLKNVDYQPFEVYTNIPHSLLSTLLVDEKALIEHLKTVFNGDKEKAETYSKYVLSAIAYHHWRENFYDIVEGNTDVFERLAKLVADKKKWNQIEENLESVYSDIGNGNVKLSMNRKWLDGLINGIRFADYVIPPYLLYRMPKRIEMDSSQLKDWVLISGFTMLSDHFASYIEGEAEENISADKVEIDGLNFDEIKKAIDFDLQKKVKGYDSSKIWQFQCVDEYKNDNTILLAPTGMGKTEFSYLWTNGVKFFYTLPLRTAVNQIFDRTKKVFGEDKAGILHSDADIYILGDGGESESMQIYEFARQLSSPAIVSTGDQFFPYALRPPSYEKIFAKFSYSRLIIDEVQAYDPKAAAIVVKFIEHVVQMGGKFLLMTATLPTFIKDEIERRIYNEKDKYKNYEELNLFIKNTELSSFSKHRIQLKVENYKEGQLSYSNVLIQEVIDKAKANEGSRVLMVLNTVKQAQAVYGNLKTIAKNSIDIRLFHSRFTQGDRRKIESKLEQFMGNNDKSRQDKRPKILVATQVVEASLDLDADYLYTELAPWDSLIQRMGRVFREYRNNSPNPNEMITKRYFQNDIPENVFILVYNGEKKGKLVFESGQGYVYHAELLRTTLKLIDNTNSVKEKAISISELKKWNNGKKVKISLNSISANSVLLTESDKSYLVENLFAGLPDNSRYLSNFYGMLQILDAGFMSDRKSDAQKVFREINDVNVISTQLRDEFLEKLKEFRYEEKYAYTRFKRDILSKYLISVQRSKVKEYLTEFYHVPYSIRLNGEITDSKVLSKLKNWLNGVYFVNLEYTVNGGLIGVNEISSFEIL